VKYDEEEEEEEIYKYSAAKDWIGTIRKTSDNHIIQRTVVKWLKGTLMQREKNIIQCRS